MEQKVQQRFLKYTRKYKNCVVWTGYKDKDGYGRFRLGDKKVRANRAAYVLFIGKIPDGKLVLHKCDNPPCVALTHLYLGSYKDNTRDVWVRGRNKKSHLYSQKNKTVCSRGHKLLGDNLYVWKTHRRCKTCHRINMLNSYHRRKNERKPQTI